LQIGLLRHEKPKSWAPKWKSRGTIYGLQTPPEKLPGRHLRSFPRRAIHAGLAPRGGAGSARPQRRLRFRPGDRPVRPPSVRLPPTIMLCPGLRPALPRGRAERIPPKKPVRRHLRPSPARPSCPGWPTPRRGGLRTPGRKPSRQPQRCHLLVTGSSPIRRSR
jgi:hypothetical protein